ncbi:MAG: tRNA pseudouridine(55) synthase TruB [Rhodoglobus sp.]
MSKPPLNPASGILLIDKPGGITSHGVVARARRLVGTRKIGHAGTLDPMATGLLVLGVNNSTRLLTWVVGLDKQYAATIRLGVSSSTDDAEGELSLPATPEALEAVSDAAIAAGVAALTGAILQRPSAVSAIKVDGKRAYTRVREGEEVILDERTVTVSAFVVRGIVRGAWVDIDVLVDCSSGTYIRALARDLGAALGVGGHLTALRRTRIGPFLVTEASTLDNERLAERMMSPADAAARLMPTIELTADEAADLTNGKRIPIDESVGAGPCAAVAPDGRLVGLIEQVSGRAHVLVNFPPDQSGADQPGAEEAAQ